MNPNGIRSLSGPEVSACLIVNADDFGISETINQGIAEAHCKGIVTAASLMAAGRAFDHAVGLCRGLPGLDVGVHLTLVAEKPLFNPDSSSLAGKDGFFPANIRMLLLYLLHGRIKLPDIRAEWAAQIERVMDSGIRVTHLDSHQHAHALPKILELTFDLACQYHIPFVRMPREDRWIARSVKPRGFVRTAGAMALRASCRLAHLNVKTTDGFYFPRFLGFHEGGHLDLKSLERILRGLKPGRVYELMCHPGFAPKENYIRRWNHHHEDELEALVNPFIRSLAAARNVRLSSFADLSDGLLLPHEHRPVLGADGK